MVVLATAGVGIVGVGPGEGQESSTSPTVTPISGPAGTPIVIGGVACCPAKEVTTTLYWRAPLEPIGTVTIAANGNATGSATIPLTAEDGIGYVTTCGRGTQDGCLLTVAFEVGPPELFATPAEARPGGGVHLSGDRWCCEGDVGTVTDLSTARDWGRATVGPAGALTADLIVPTDALPGQTELDVCVSALCATVIVTVLEAPTPTDPTPTDPTAPTSPTAPTAPAGPTVPPTPQGTAGPVASTGETAPDVGVHVPTEPTKHDGRPVVGALVVTVVLVSVIGLLLDHVVRRRSRSAVRRPTARVLLQPDPGKQTIAGPTGPTGPTLGLCAVIDLARGATTINEK